MQKKINRCISIIIYVYILFLIGVYPLLTQEGYYCLADFKYSCYAVATVVFLAAGAFALLIRESMPNRKKQSLNVIDKVVLAYGVFAILSFATSDYKRMGFWGADGWYMGLLTQLLFVAVYFVVSRALISWNMQIKYLLVPVMISMSIVSMIGILQCAGIDMFGWYSAGYDGLEGEFFSTMGQSSWYGAFLTLQNGFAAILIWFAFSLDEKTEWSLNSIKWKSFIIAFKVLSLIALLGIKAQAGYGIVILIAIADIIFVMSRKGASKKAYGVLIGSVIGIVVLCIVFGVMNTIGAFGNKYLGLEGIFYFDGFWGNYRGIIWSHSFEAWKSLELKKKILGIGPDCYYYAAYSIDPARLQSYISAAILQNAHNEWMNSIICYGILGGVAYIGVFASSICSALADIKNRKNELYAGAFLLLVLIYSFYGMFCYQQCYSTPIIFVIMAVYSGYNRRKKD